MPAGPSDVLESRMPEKSPRARVSSRENEAICEVPHTLGRITARPRIFEGVSKINVPAAGIEPRFEDWMEGLAAVAEINIVRSGGRPVVEDNRRDDGSLEPEIGRAS